MKIKVEDLIDITMKVDDILHDQGFSVNHDILSTYILDTIRESYPKEDIELELKQNKRSIKFGASNKKRLEDSKT